MTQQFDIDERANRIARCPVALGDDAPQEERDAVIDRFFDEYVFIVDHSFKTAGETRT